MGRCPYFTGVDATQLWEAQRACGTVVPRPAVEARQRKRGEPVSSADEATVLQKMFSSFHCY